MLIFHSTPEGKQIIRQVCPDPDLLIFPVGGPKQQRPLKDRQGFMAFVFESHVKGQGTWYV